MNQAMPNDHQALVTNRFELRLGQNRQSADTDPRWTGPDQLYLYATIWIDGQLLDEPHPVCVLSVLQSMVRPRPKSQDHSWYDVFTCGCGAASCANIDEGVGVVHSDDHVDWIFRRPQANHFGADPYGYKMWCETAKWHQYRFDRHQVTRELSRFLDEVWMVVKTSDVKLDNEFDVLYWFYYEPRKPLRYRGTTPTEPDADQT